MQPLTAAAAVLIATGVTGLASYLYLAIHLSRLMRLARGEGAGEPVAGLVLLALSHAATLLLALQPPPRITVAAYTASASFAAAGLLLLATPKTGMVPALAPVLVPAAYDALAALAAVMAAKRFHGAARLFTSLIALGYAARLLGILLPEAQPLILAGEVVRSTSAAGLAAYYAAPAATFHEQTPR